MRSKNNLRSVDLNLLVVLEALLEELNVSRAAARLGMTQPAVSHALSRLRQLFDDPLLVRAGRSMVATATALALGDPLASVLSKTRSLFGAAEFDPSTSKAIVRLAMSDYGSSIVLPGLVARLRRCAPGIALRVRHLSREHMLRAVEDGIIDAAIGVFPAPPQALEHRVLFEERFVCVLDKRHARARRLDLEGYLAASHVLVSMSGEPGGEVDVALASIGRQREVAAIVPHFSVAHRVVKGSDLVLTVAKRAVPPDVARLGLVVREVPLEVPPFAFALLGRRQMGPSAGCWVRQQIVDQFAG